MNCLISNTDMVSTRALLSDEPNDVQQITPKPEGRVALFGGGEDGMSYLISNGRVSTKALYGSDDYIAHALNLQWGKHKYIRRTGTPGNYVYTYAQDLRNAGRKLVSNARNTARNVANRVGSAVGSTQRRAMINANLRFAGARARLNASMATYDGSRRADRDFHRASRAASGAENRARDARIEYRKTPLGKAEQAVNNIRKTIRDLPGEVRYQATTNIPYEIGSFLTSTVGVGYRDRIRKARADYKDAWDAASRDVGNFNYGPSERQRSARLDATANVYSELVSDYGKTFLGKCEKLLNTPFSYTQYMYIGRRDWKDI